MLSKLHSLCMDSCHVTRYCQKFINDFARIRIEIAFEKIGIETKRLPKLHNSKLAVRS